MATVNTYIQSLYGGLAELANLTYPISLEGLLVLYGNIDHLTIGA